MIKEKLKIKVKDPILRLVSCVPPDSLGDKICFPLIKKGACLNNFLKLVTAVGSRAPHCGLGTKLSAKTISFVQDSSVELLTNLYVAKVIIISYTK